MKTPFFRPENALFSTRFSTFGNFRKVRISRKSESAPSQPRAKPRFPGGVRNPRFFFAKKHVFCPQEKGPFFGSEKNPEKTGKKCTFLHVSGTPPRTRQNPEFRVSYFCRFRHPSGNPGFWVSRYHSTRNPVFCLFLLFLDETAHFPYFVRLFRKNAFFCYFHGISSFSHDLRSSDLPTFTSRMRHWESIQFYRNFNYSNPRYINYSNIQLFAQNGLLVEIMSDLYDCYQISI